MLSAPTDAPADIAAASPATFTISELAQEFQVTLRTLRFYEAKGFITPEREGAERRFNQNDRNRIAFILQAKRLGFTLREIGGLMASRECSSGAVPLSRAECTEQINLLERQKRAIEQALAELRHVYSSHYLRTLAERGFDHD